MANEITASASLSYLNTPAGVMVAQSLGTTAPLTITIAGKAHLASLQTIPTTAGGTAINKGSLASIGWYIVFNRDSMNFLQILTAVSGTAFHKILPGEFVMGRLDPGITAPAAKADTASISIQYLFLEI